jgi:cyanophycinase
MIISVITTKIATGLVKKYRKWLNLARWFQICVTYTMENQKAECPVPVGTLVVIGGKENKSGKPDDRVQEKNGSPFEILKTMVKLCNKEDPLIEIITTASSEGDESFEDYVKVFSKIGVKRTRHIHHKSRGEVMSEDFAHRVKEADIFFFAGGDQLKLTSVYGGTNFLMALKERYIYEPVIIAGTSAGAMALSTPMIYAGSNEVQELSGEIKVTTGLEFMKDICIDTHFVHRGRFVRMAQVIITNPGCLGLGIEEDTAMIVRNGTDVTVIGSGIVIVIDGLHADHPDVDAFANQDAVSIRNLTVHLLAKNDQYTIPQVNPPHR